MASDRAAVGGVAVALVGAVALVAGVRGVYGNIWRDLTAGTGPQVSNPATSTAGAGSGGGGIGTILEAGGAAAHQLITSAQQIYQPQTPNGRSIAGAQPPDHSSPTPFGAWSVAAGTVTGGAPLLTSYNAAHDTARWSYAQNSNESSWEHVDRLTHDLMRAYGWPLGQARDEVLRELYAAVTAAGGDWSATGFGPVPLTGILHV